MMSIDTLIMAAEYLDRKDREADHGYASTLPCPRFVPGAFSSSSSSSSLASSPTAGRIDRRRASRLKHTQGIRTSHNELEKNRRAHMKRCLELLKGVVPLVGDVTKHTTLGLLNSATAMINALHETELIQKRTKDQLLREQQYLRLQYEQLRKAASGTAVGQQQQQQRFRALIGQYGQYRVRPSVSESSDSSGTSVESSENDNDIDVINTSDDDCSSDIICGIASQSLEIEVL